MSARRKPAPIAAAVTAGELAARLAKMPAGAPVVFRLGGSHVVEAVSGAVGVLRVSRIGEHHFTTLGPDRDIDAVIIDADDLG